MSTKKKADKLSICISAVLSMATVLLIWLMGQPRFQFTAICIAIGALVAFLSEVLLLTVLKGKNPVKRAVKIILLFVMNISVFVCAVIYGIAPAFILQPHSDEASYKALADVSLAEEISFAGTNGLINGWFYNAAGENAPTVLYFYGNYETASTRLLSLTENYENSAFANCNFAVFDYPSYGKSEGRCTDKSILQFSLDVFDELSKKTDEIIVLGYSVGTGQACYVASEREVKSLILYAPYAESADLYNNVIDIFHGPLEKLVAFDISNIGYAKNITEPTLILASFDDEVIPVSSSEKLVPNFGGPCTLIKTHGDHNHFFSSDFIKEKTSVFIKGGNVCE